MGSRVDLAIIFRSGAKSKAEAADAAAEYKRLLAVLTDGGLKAIGKKGASDSELLIFVWCPENKLQQLAEHERRTDFVYGVARAKVPSLTSTGNPDAVTPAERIRLVYAYISSPKADSGLGVAPGSPHWTRIQSIMALQDRDFNRAWLSNWTRKQVGFSIPISELDKIRDNFGESLALYFSFLSFYTRALFVPATLGLISWVLKAPYHPLYSLSLSLWAIATVDIWRVCERALSVRWGTHGVARVERRRVEFIAASNQDPSEENIAADADALFPWWKREFRMALSVPVISLFGILLGGLLTAIFLFEAFVTQLYDGPGKDYLGFIPTIIFVTVIPRIMGVYNQNAGSLTKWENHAHESSFNRSLTLKTFALSSIVAFLGLFLTAFVYIPFGPDVMRWVNTALFDSGHPDIAEAATDAGIKPLLPPIDIQAKINPGRLHAQMFAYTVTNQAINFFLETGLPFILRGIAKARVNRNIAGKRKDENPDAVTQLVENAREESALPEYTLFADYAEMVTQFGYIVIWSAAWPLAPLMALLNNWLELRSDAFKITSHGRRPLPQRVDTVGPWLEALGFITWVGALTNAALVYLFRPMTVGSHGRTTTAAQSGSPFLTTTLGRDIKVPHFSAGNATFGGKLGLTHATSTLLTAVLPAVLAALAASHAFFVVRALIRHVVERAVWRGSAEYRALGKAEREVKRKFLAEGGGNGFVPGVASNGIGAGPDAQDDGTDLWTGPDEGASVFAGLIKGE
ncbi:response to osmotic stress-like protein [Rhizoctonia solani 123E]|uniref:Response to osmotic stress-like protein n=1 Tax=Rhizoctonia solani 123E TaxID=1423351 RepID=A0A074RSG2_9AGAM|nr:response to osmotic stress-like protein [Rhizoctonia solani 123E]